MALEYRMKQAKANRVLPRICAGIANTLLQQHREDSTHGHYQIVNTEIRLIIFFAAKDGEALYSKQKQGKADCGSDHELLIAKFRLK